MADCQDEAQEGEGSAVLPNLQLLFRSRREASAVASGGGFESTFEEGFVDGLDTRFVDDLASYSILIDPSHGSPSHY